MVDQRRRYRGEGRFEQWLFTIARNVCLDRLRAASRYERLPGRAERTIPAAGPGPDRLVAVRDEIARRLSVLSVRQREVLMLNRYEGFTYRELGEHLVVCGECARDYALLRDTWALLPEPAPLPVPESVRRAVLAHAHGGQSRSIRPLPRWLPLATGAVSGALAIVAVAAIAARGGFRELGPEAEAGLIALFVVLASLLGAGATGLARGRSRDIAAGALAALGGYTALTMAFPVNQSVDACGRALFGSFLSLYEICSTYLVVTAGYAAIPPLILGLVWTADRPGWDWSLASGVIAAAVLPLLLLQAGFDTWLVPVSAAAGLGVGIWCGILGARCTRWCFCGPDWRGG